MRPNEVFNDKDSQDLQVESLKDGEVATFKLVNAFRKATDREGNNVPESYVLAERQTVVNPFTKKRVTIGNVVGEEQREGADGRPFMKPILKRVEFLRGLKHVRADEDETWQYMMRRKDNESNTYAKAMGGRKMVYKLVNDKKELVDALLIEDLKFHVQKLIRETKDPVKLKAWAGKLNKSADTTLHIKAEEPQGIKYELMQIGKVNPKAVLYSADDPTSKVRVQILEAINFGVLFFAEGAFQTIRGKKAEELFRPGADEEKFESMVEFCMSEQGKPIYVAIAQALKRATQVDASRSV